jgi:hypothetical protein
LILSAHITIKKVILFTTTMFDEIYSRPICYYYDYNDDMSLFDDVKNALALSTTPITIAESSKFVTFISKKGRRSLMHYQKSSSFASLNIIFNNFEHIDKQNVSLTKLVSRIINIIKTSNICAESENNKCGIFEWVTTLTNKGYIVTESQNCDLIKLGMAASLENIIKKSTFSQQEFQTLFLLKDITIDLFEERENMFKKIKTLMKKHDVCIDSLCFDNAIKCIIEHEEYTTASLNSLYKIFKSLQYSGTVDNMMYVYTLLRFRNMLTPNVFVDNCNKLNIIFGIDDMIKLAHMIILHTGGRIWADDKNYSKMFKLCNLNNSILSLEQIKTIPCVEDESYDHGYLNVFLKHCKLDLTQELFEYSFKIKNNIIFLELIKQKTKIFKCTQACMAYAIFHVDVKRVEYCLRNKIMPTEQNVLDICKHAVYNKFDTYDNNIINKHAKIIQMFNTFGVKLTLPMCEMLYFSNIELEGGLPIDKSKVDRLHEFMPNSDNEKHNKKSKKVVNHMATLTEKFKRNDMTDILTYIEEHKLTPNISCFENALMNCDTSVLDYVIKHYKYKPTIMAIMRIEQECVRFFMFKYFFPEHSAIDYGTIDSVNNVNELNDDSSDEESIEVKPKKKVDSKLPSKRKCKD